MMQIKSTDNFWNWTINTMIPNLRASQWYNSKQPFGLRGFIDDKASRMMGYATMRQVRIKKGNNIGSNPNIHFWDQL